MVNKSGDIGTRTAQKFIEGALIPHGFPHAERRDENGINDRGDIAGCIGIVWQIKGGHAAEQAGPDTIAKWLDETERQRRNAGARLGILVTKRKGVGMTRPGEWWAWLTVAPAGIDTNLGEADVLWAPLRRGRDEAIFPVRMLAADAVRMVRAWGYGTPEVAA